MSSDYIAIFLSLISSFCGQHLKIQNVQSVENEYFYPTEYLNTSYV